MSEEKKSEKPKYILVLASFLFVFGTVSLFYKIQHGKRFPAAISDKDYEVFELASSEDFLSGISIEDEKSQYHLHFSNLGKLCDEYHKYTLVFMSPNVHVSGESPTLEITSPCESVDGKSLSLSIPYKRLMQERPGNFSAAYRRPASIEVEAKDVIGFWPERWLLSKIRFTNIDNGTTKVFNKKQVSYHTNDSIIMRWK